MDEEQRVKILRGMPKIKGYRLINVPCCKTCLNVIRCPECTLECRKKKAGGMWVGADGKDWHQFYEYVEALGWCPKYAYNENWAD